MELLDLLLLAFEKQALSKAVLSKPADRAQIKTVITARVIGKKPVLQAETFLADNKAVHENIAPENRARLAALIDAHGQATSSPRRERANCGAPKPAR